VSLLLARRPITDGDLEFLYRVYASTRTEELAPVPWTDAQKEGFLRMQFNAQHSHYQQHYKDSEFSILSSSGTDVGRLYVHRGPTDIRVVDVALLPEFRGHGWGTALLRGLMAEATATRTVSVHVERNNPALRLYARLGFTVVTEGPVYLLMHWRPPETLPRTTHD